MVTMGGPYIPFETLQKVLARLLKGGRPFYGRIEIECENGEVCRITKHESMKLPEIERILTS